MSNAPSVAFQRLAGLTTRWPARCRVSRLVDYSVRFSHSIRADGCAVKDARLLHRTQRRGFSQTTATCLKQSPILSRLRPLKSAPKKEEPIEKEDPNEEKGLAFRADDLSKQELDNIFGPVYPPIRQANHILRILHGRRNDGTLDLPLSPKMQELLKMYPFVESSGLHWLRQKYPLDEDAAIMARLEREELGEDYSPSELEQRGQDIGLYGPQSGHYQAKLSDSDREGDVWGQSELDRIRTENEAKIAAEEAEFQAEIDQKMAEAQAKQEELAAQRELEAPKSPEQNALEARPEQGLSSDVRELRPPNEFEKWVMRAHKHGTSQFDLESKQIKEMTFARRVLPSAFFVALVCIGCYLWAQYWQPPRRADRRFPDISLTYATLYAIAGMNVAIYLAWKFPPMWRLLNTSFVMTPAYPKAVSMIGSTFSHQKARHLISNMFALALFGSSLHEEVGRGTFLAIYLAGGCVGSLANLTLMAARGILITSSVGASGSMYAVFAALMWLNNDKMFQLFFLPEEYQEYVQFKGWVPLAGFFAWEAFRLTQPVRAIDHAGHLGGMITGIVVAQMLRMRMGEKEEEARGQGVNRNLREWRSWAGEVVDGGLGVLQGAKKRPEEDGRSTPGQAVQSALKIKVADTKDGGKDSGTS